MLPTTKARPLLLCQLLWRILHSGNNGGGSSRSSGTRTYRTCPTRRSSHRHPPICQRMPMGLAVKRYPLLLDPDGNPVDVYAELGA